MRKPLLRAFGAAMIATTACAPDAALDETGDVTAEARVRLPLDRTAGAMIAGSSADQRLVAYGVRCDAGDETTELRLVDARNGRTRTLARGWSCTPGSVRFSPDGSLAVYGLQGALRAVDTTSGRTVTVSREGGSGIGVVFSPDSQWFAVATLNGTSSALDAWERDLRTRTEVSAAAYASPFGPPDAGLKVSPDGRALLFVGDVAGPFPVGNLTLWRHDTRRARSLATGVLAGAYTLTADWRRIAYVGGLTAPAPGAPPSPDALAGELTVRDLDGARSTVVESRVSTSSLEFARNGDALVYVSGGFPPGTPATLKAWTWGSAAPVTLDANVYPMFAPARSVVVNPAGDAVAYSTGLVPERFVAALRVTTLPANLRDARTVTVADEAVPGTAAYNRDGALVYLHTPTATFPLAVGTLSAWSPASRTARVLGTEVAQVGLRVESARREVLFVSAYDAGNAIGTLRFWDGLAAQARTLGTRAAVMSLTPSPAWQRVAFVTLAPAAEGEVPATALRVARLVGAPSTVRIDDGPTSQLVADDGTTLYTTADALWRSASN